MQIKAFVRVFCVDGPCPGLNYADADSGQILFRESSRGERYFYRIDQDAYNSGRRPRASFDRIEAASAA